MKVYKLPNRIDPQFVKKGTFQWSQRKLGLAMLDIANGTFYENFVRPLHEMPKVTS